MIFSVQNSNLLYSRDVYSFTQFIAQNDLLSAKQQQPLVLVLLARHSLRSFSGTNGHPNPSLAYGGSDAKGLQRTSYDTSSHDREPTWRNANDGGTFWLCGHELPEIPGSRFVAQPVDDFVFPWEEAGSAENPITKDEDEGFSETMTPPAPK